jgi:type VI secretion system ImpA family protein
MTQAFHFDIEKLLSPISAEHPAGESLRYEGTYDRIREARREDDPGLPQGVWKTELRKAQWQVVESLSVEALETRSKDIQIAAWLTEAWLNLYSFRGAAKGLELTRALCESFWDDLHPGIEGGDLEFRLAPLEWINEKLAVSLKLRPITEPDAHGERTYCWADWENASRLDNAALRPLASKPVPDGSLTVAKFQQSAMLTPTSYFRGLRRDVQELLDASVGLEQILDEKAGKSAPGLLKLRAVGESIATFLDSLLLQRNEPEGDPTETVADNNGMTDDDGDTDREVPNLPIPSRIRDRADAYYLLAEAADFLARTEPHSPTPYLVRRAIAWGAMSLDELLPQLVRNSAELEEIFRLLQINRVRPPIQS